MEVHIGELCPGKCLPFVYHCRLITDLFKLGQSSGPMHTPRIGLPSLQTDRRTCILRAIPPGPPESLSCRPRRCAGSISLAHLAATRLLPQACTSKQNRLCRRFGGRKSLPGAATDPPHPPTRLPNSPLPRPGDPNRTPSWRSHHFALDRHHPVHALHLQQRALRLPRPATRSTRLFLPANPSPRR